MSQQSAPADRSFALPPLGDNPSTERQGTRRDRSPHRGPVGTPWTFSSPDTPGMPGVSRVDRAGFRLRRAIAKARRSSRKRDSGRDQPGDEAGRPARAAPHAEQIRVEVAAGRMIIPANKVHLKLQARADVHRPGRR